MTTKQRIIMHRGVTTSAYTERFSETPDGSGHQRNIDLTIAEVLGLHHPAKGMRPAMGVTCDCGFWEHRNTRRTPTSDGLDLHRAQVLMTAFRIECA